MTFLIDGYNLMYAAGLAQSAMAPAQFDRARGQFLDWLADGARARAQLRVIFDAQQASSPSLESLHRGVRVRYAFRQTADDLIEELVAVEQCPDRLTVVSDDLRVREAARRAACRISSCGEFMDWLLLTDSQARPTQRQNVSDKPIPAITDEDNEEWLNAFTLPKPKPKR
jgi:predicted RNA-binding protein with PIN domain